MNRGCGIPAHPRRVAAVAVTASGAGNGDTPAEPDDGIHGTATARAREAEESARDAAEAAVVAFRQLVRCKLR